MPDDDDGYAEYYDACDIANEIFKNEKLFADLGLVTLCRSGGGGIAVTFINREFRDSFVIWVMRQELKFDSISKFSMHEDGKLWLRMEMENENIREKLIEILCDITEDDSEFRKLEFRGEKYD